MLKASRERKERRRRQEERRDYATHLLLIAFRAHLAARVARGEDVSKDPRFTVRLAPNQQTKFEGGDEAEAFLPKGSRSELEPVYVLSPTYGLLGEGVITKTGIGASGGRRKVLVKLTKKRED